MMLFLIPKIRHQFTDGMLKEDENPNAGISHFAIVSAKSVVTKGDF